jgi:HEAT repeat protein
VVREESSRADGNEVLDVAACARALGAFGARAQLELAPLLAHPAPDVRRAAADGLSAARARQVAPLVQHQLEREKDESVRRSLTRALEALSPKQPAPSP